MSSFFFFFCLKKEIVEKSKSSSSQVQCTARLHTSNYNACINEFVLGTFLLPPLEVVRVAHALFYFTFYLFIFYIFVLYLRVALSLQIKEQPKQADRPRFF